MDEKVETHKKKFRGTWAHAILHQLVERGEINTSEAWLCLIIDGFMKPGGRGCFASSEYLAKKLFLGERQVQQMLKKLSGEDLNLLRILKKPGWKKRYLRTTFDKAEVTLGHRLKKVGAENCAEGAKNCAPETTKRKKLRQVGAKNCAYIVNKEVMNNEDAQQPLDAATDNAEDSPLFEIDESSVQVIPEDRQLALQFMTGLFKNKKLSKKPDLKEWARQLAVLRYVVSKMFDISLDRACKRLQQVVKDYLSYMDRKYMPEAYKPESFAEKFVRIEKAIEREKSGNQQFNRDGSKHRDDKCTRDLLGSDDYLSENEMW